MSKINIYIKKHQKNHKSSKYSIKNTVVQRKVFFFFFVFYHFFIAFKLLTSYRFLHTTSFFSPNSLLFLPFWLVIFYYLKTYLSVFLIPPACPIFSFITFIFFTIYKFLQSMHSPIKQKNM